MPTKVSEKKLALAIFCLAAGIFIFVKTPVVMSPVHLSEKGLLLCMAAFALVAFALWFFRKAVSKV